MKTNLIKLFSIFVSICFSQNEYQGDSAFEAEFNKVAKTYQDAYMNANCEVIIPYLDENLVIYENGEHWPYAKLVEYCPHLPVKPVINTDRSYKILSKELVYEFVSQTYQSKSGKTFNETQALIWEFKNKTWKIINYDVSRYTIKSK